MSYSEKSSIVTTTEVSRPQRPETMPPFSFSRPDSLRIHPLSRPVSRPGSLDGGMSMDGSSERHNLMVKYLYARVRSNQWFGSTGGSGVVSAVASTRQGGSDEDHDTFNRNLGVLLRVSKGQYATNPSPVCYELLAAVVKLNVEVAFTMCTDVTDLIFNGLDPNKQELVFPRDSTRYQIIDSLADIATAPAARLKKYQYGCLVRTERLVLVWGNSVDEILERGLMVEKKLLEHIWGRPTLLSQDMRSTSYLAVKEAAVVPEVIPVEPGDDTDVEKGDSQDALSRPLVLTSAIFIGLAMTLNIVLLFGLGLRNLISESLIDHSYIRFALAITLPAFSLFGLFFVIVIFGNLFQAFGPVKNVQQNSRSYSFFPPSLSTAYSNGFRPPHITIQMPVYKESLKGVIEPTIQSLREAISHYELSGGSASIFVNDDGLQLISEEEKLERMAYYEDNNIGWVARPGHGKDGFIRAGKFKKASNMNFALDISNKTEDVLLQLIEMRKREAGVEDISDVEEEELYQTALTQVIEADGKAWASGNIRVGEHILIIDSDTRVPVDCLMNGAAEMFLSPEVAIIQHSCGVMQVVGDFFENGVTFFTNLIYSSIRFSIGSGEVAPFVGHNAFLRWQAVQSVSYTGEDGKQKFWSESHVSEDFDIALRLQVTGNIVRLACYQGEDFREGVSLTVFDELNRWTKYAYGCNELVFHPIYTWLWRGPFTPLFKKFIFSNMQISSKISITAYISTYYALAFGLPMTLANYFLVGWYATWLDKFYIDSWKILVGLLVVFSGSGNVTLAILRYRLGEKGLLKSLLENFRWLPMFTIFFGGLSFHLSLAILAHMFSINMSWGATAKELERSNFFKEVPKIFKTFKWMYLLCFCIIGAMIYLGVAAPDGWEITEAVAIVPLSINIVSHMLLPFVLNPALMVFNY